MHVGCARTISPYTERSATTSRIWPHGAGFCRPRQLDAAALSMSATDVIEIGQQFYIRARSSLADARILSLLDNDTLAIFDRHGDIQPIGLAQQGIFFQDTRHLSTDRPPLCIRAKTPCTARIARRSNPTVHRQLAS